MERPVASGMFPNSVSNPATRATVEDRIAAKAGIEASGCGWVARADTGLWDVSPDASRRNARLGPYVRCDALDANVP